MGQYLFHFNSDISKWDVSRVTNMEHMFYYAESFNADISKWDVSKVKHMRNMFHAARSFNRDISEWDVSNVKEMQGMFGNTDSFNQVLCGEWKKIRKRPALPRTQCSSSHQGNCAELLLQYLFCCRSSVYSPRTSTPFIITLF